MLLLLKNILQAAKAARQLNTHTCSKQQSLTHTHLHTHIHERRDVRNQEPVIPVHSCAIAHFLCHPTVDTNRHIHIHISKFVLAPALFFPTAVPRRPKLLPFYVSTALTRSLTHCHERSLAHLFSA